MFRFIFLLTIQNHAVHLSGPPREPAQLAGSVGTEQTRHQDSLVSGRVSLGESTHKRQATVKIWHDGISAAFQNPYPVLGGKRLMRNACQTIFGAFGKQMFVEQRFLEAGCVKLTRVLHLALLSRFSPVGQLHASEINFERQPGQIRTVGDSEQDFRNAGGCILQ